MGQLYKWTKRIARDTMKVFSKGPL